MARKRSSSFGADEGLFDNLTAPHAHEVQQVQEQPLVHHTQEVHEVQEEPVVPPVHTAQDVQQVQEVSSGRELGSTQGKKGQKLRRINMAFSDQNHAYITQESRRRGISATAFVNQIITDYRSR